MTRAGNAGRQERGTWNDKRNKTMTGKQNRADGLCMKARQPKYSEPKGSARYYWLLW